MKLVVNSSRILTYNKNNETQARPTQNLAIYSTSKRIYRSTILKCWHFC